jgi:uncharacterized membrane protein YfcA
LFPLHEFLVFTTAIIAGAINSVAGGGSLVTFPTLIWLGVPSVVANATNTVAIWPGTLGSAWAYRRELRGIDPKIYWLVLPSTVGAVGGAMLLRLTPTALFDRFVPILVLFATLLFMLQEPIQRRFNLRVAHEKPHWFATVVFYQFLVGLYGGYFGAAIGILMLAALSLMGHTEIHQMNAIKNFLATFINATAAIYFMATGLYSRPDAIVMAVGAIIGGVGGTMVALRIGPTAVRRVVIAIGLSMSIALMIRTIRN